MLHVDVLSAYLNCGVSALVGAAMLRIAETDDEALRRALRTCGTALITLGVALLPAGLGEGAAHPAAQYSLIFGSLAAMAVLARGLSQIQGRPMSTPFLAAVIAGLAIVLAYVLTLDRLAFGRLYSLGLASAATLMVWYDVLKRADAGLYRAKAEGRNQVQVSVMAA